VKKDQPRNGCDGRLMAKILITTIQVNLVPNPSGEGTTNLPELLLIQFFAINLPSQPDFGCHFLFHVFFTMALLGAAELLYSWAVLD